MDRLDTIASLVKSNSTVCDIGCDHAYLLLKLYDKIAKGYACDISEKPLNSAKKTIRENNLYEKIEPVLSNGLENISSDQFDTLVIAGMGGELILNILDASKYIKNKKYDIILQPMSKSSELRNYLYANGFSIEKEVISIEDRRVYTIIFAKYTGETKVLPLYECFVSDALKNDANFDKFLNYHINRFETIIKNMENSQNIDNFTHYNDILSFLKELKND